MSLLIITLITGVRYLHITKNVQIAKKIIVLVVLTCWMFSFFFTSLPLSGVGEFARWQYIKSEACLLYNFSYGLVPGWWYGFMFFILFNVMNFALIFVAYGRIIIHIKQSIKNLGVVLGRQDKTMAALRSVLVLIGSNLLIWLPVLIISILNLAQVQTPKIISR